MVPAVVFDLDGTLVDSAPDLVATLNTIFAREGLPPVRGLKAEGRTFPAAEVDRLCRDFIEHYAAHIADQSRPFPGIETALDEIAARGSTLIVCTNKLEWLSVRLLDALGLSKRFAVICGADTFGLKKPNPELLHRTLERAAARPDCAVMVGDSVNDVDMARAAGIPVIAVDFGYTEIPVRELKADLVISGFRDLPKAVFGLLKRRDEVSAQGT